MRSGIYCIENLANGKVYIGRAKDIQNRWHVHRKDLRRGRHYNKHLQRSWNENGEDQFKFFVLEYCDLEKLPECEQFWLDTAIKVNTRAGVYNARDKADIRPPENKVPGLTEEHKAKIGKANKGKKRSQEFKDFCKQRKFEKQVTVQLQHKKTKEIIEVTGLREFCRGTNIDWSSFTKLRRGVLKSCKGWKIYTPERK